jgi:hypothetical protein
VFFIALGLKAQWVAKGQWVAVNNLMFLYVFLKGKKPAMFGIIFSFVFVRFTVQYDAEHIPQNHRELFFFACLVFCGFCSLWPPDPAGLGENRSWQGGVWFQINNGGNIWF